MLNEKEHARAQLRLNWILVDLWKPKKVQSQLEVKRSERFRKFLQKIQIGIISKLYIDRKFVKMK